ncbi:MAG: family 10 glycosylhydrolase [Clostridiales bacterium]|nr:family 10 glycosylhydrolase [Clostridiales bacterium]
MFGVWMWPESVRLRGADAVFGDCRRAGITDVFFLTKGLAGTTAFPSPLAPPTEEGRDLLREALDAAHERGIRLHAWFTSASDARYCSAHPEVGLCHFTKGLSEKIVSIADADYTRYMQSVLAEMLCRYDVDGVHLDYIRYNHLLYGWNETDRRRYRDAGIDLAHAEDLLRKTFYGGDGPTEAIFDAYRAGDADVIRLAELRADAVMRFASSLAQVVRQESGAVLSMALMPEGAYTDSAFADLHYGQRYERLADLADLFLPMAYSQAYHKDARWTAEVARGTVKKAAGRAKVVTGLHAYEGGTGLTLEADRRAAEAVPGTDGVCLFREGAFVWAFCDGRSLMLADALPKPVTSITVRRGEASLTRSIALEPGGSWTVDLPFAPDTVRAWTADGEVCAALV